MIDVHQNLVLSSRFCAEGRVLPHLTRDITRHHYCPVLSGVSLPRLSKRRRQLKFRLGYVQIFFSKLWSCLITHSNMLLSKFSLSQCAISFVRDTLIPQHQQTSTRSQYCYLVLGIQYGCLKIMQKYSVGNTVRFTHV